MVFGVGVDDEDDTTPAARRRCVDARWPDGAPLFTPLVCFTLMVYYVFAMQCMSTIAIVRRETNRWRWPLFQIGYMTGTAWVVSFVVYQGDGCWASDEHPANHDFQLADVGGARRGGPGRRPVVPLLVASPRTARRLRLPRQPGGAGTAGPEAQDPTVAWKVLRDPRSRVVGPAFPLATLPLPALSL